MRDRPSAMDILEIAHEVMRERLLPLLPPEFRRDGLMVASAIVNAIREIQAGEGPMRAEGARLAALYGAQLESITDESVADILMRLNRRLVADIRVGRFDADSTLEDHLLATAIDAVRETNPKFLANRKLA